MIGHLLKVQILSINSQIHIKLATAIFLQKYVFKWLETASERLLVPVDIFIFLIKDNDTND